MQYKTAAILIGVSLILSGCISTPEPDPVAVVQDGDDGLTCDAIFAQYAENTETAATKIAANKASDRKDLAIGILIWPGLVDYNNAPGHEGNALLDRNLHLIEIATSKACNISDWPEQHERY